MTRKELRKKAEKEENPWEWREARDKAVNKHRMTDKVFGRTDFERECAASATLVLPSKTFKPFCRL